MDSLVPRLIESLSLHTPVSVEEAGQKMLDLLSEGTLSREQFLASPRSLIDPGRGVPRFVAQVAWRAVSGEYRTTDEIVSSLSGIIDRNPPTLEATSGEDDGRIVFPEVRVLRIEPGGGAGQHAAFEAHVTSGPFRDQEITVRVAAEVNPTAAAAVSLFWIHSSVALYNLELLSDSVFSARPDTFFILEPLRQVNATAIARSLACPRPEIDSLRQGRGETSAPMIRGLVVHSILDRLIAGEDDLQRCYEQALAPFMVQLAALAGDDLDEDSFRSEVLAHGQKLQELIAANPQMRSDPQVEVRRYSPTIGIQGRIDAVFRSGTTLEIVELKTGKRLRREDHAQVYVYRLLLSDAVRRARREDGIEIELRSRLISSHDGSSTLSRPAAGFLDIVHTRNHLIALTWSLGRNQPHLRMPYADYDRNVCGVCPPWTRSRCRTNTHVLGEMPNSEESPDLAYFRRFSRLVRQESWAQSEDLASLLDDSRLAERVRDFRTIEEARCTGHGGGVFSFEFPRNPSELAVGDRVLIHMGEISSRTSYQGYVRFIEPTRAGIAIPLRNLQPEAFEGGRSWIIDRLTTDLTAEASQTALYDFLTQATDDLRRVVLGEVTPPTASTRSVREIDAPALNPSQQSAVSAAAVCPLFHLVWGPPGTGKTRIIPDIVRSVSGGVLLGAFTNTAVDNMLMALLDRDPAARFLRIGRSESSPELAARLGERAQVCFSDDLASSTSSPSQLRRWLDDIPVVAATAHRAASHPYLRGRAFDMVIVDEAGQLTEPLSLGLVMRGRRFVLIGDDLQLPPVVRTQGLDVSLFERLKAQVEVRAPGAMTLLDVQYRMHPDIMAIPNRLYYGGRLRAGVAAGDRRPPRGRPLSFVPVDAEPVGRSNPEEARVVGRLTRELLEHVSAESIGVISPFRAQVALLREELRETGVTVDTVERYQGGERDVILVSFVRSRGTAFVFDDHRLNVAMTRARSKLILVAHPELFTDTKFAWVSDHEGDSAAPSATRP